MGKTHTLTEQHRTRLQNSNVRQRCEKNGRPAKSNPTNFAKFSTSLAGKSIRCQHYCTKYLRSSITIVYLLRARATSIL